MARTTRPDHAGKDAAGGPGSGATTGTPRWQKVVGTIGLVVVLWVGNDLLEVVTSGGERPGGGTPPAGEQGPPASAPHDPSQFRH